MYLYASRQAGMLWGSYIYLLCQFEPVRTSATPDPPLLKISTIHMQYICKWFDGCFGIYLGQVHSVFIFHWELFTDELRLTLIWVLTLKLVVQQQYALSPSTHHQSTSEAKGRMLIKFL